MKERPSKTEKSSDRRDLDPKTTARLLELGLSGPRKPADDLLERLERKEGRRWFSDRVLAGISEGGFENPDRLAPGEATLEELIALKDWSKGEVSGSSGDRRLAGLAGYFLAVAAALVHYQKLICGRTRGELDPVLFDLATAVPSPWDDLFVKAARSSSSVPRGDLP